MTYVADTHAIVWFLEGSSRLSPAARAALADPAAQLILPALVLVEVGFLHARRRVNTGTHDLIAYVQGSSNCAVYPLDDVVAQRAPKTLDIHDAIIVATALVVRDSLDPDTALVTCDQQVTASGLIQVIW